MSGIEQRYRRAVGGRSSDVHSIAVVQLSERDWVTVHQIGGAFVTGHDMWNLPWPGRRR